MKDNFSQNSDNYARYRPTYPQNLYDYLYSRVNQQKRVWDVGCGNGQVAKILAQSFDEVYASDISAAQIVEAPMLGNIFYSQQAAEETNYPNNFFDLITVGQAVHWFDFERFFIELRRVAKKDALVAFFGYGLFSSFPEADLIIKDFYHNIIGPYWDVERQHIDNSYESIPFPFAAVETKQFEMALTFDIEDLMGYFGTWSAVKHYQNKTGNNPLVDLKTKLAELWTEPKVLRFPIFMKAGLMLL